MKRRERHEEHKPGPLSGGQSTEDSELFPKSKGRILSKEHYDTI